MLSAANLHQTTPAAGTVPDVAIGSLWLGLACCSCCQGSFPVSLYHLYAVGLLTAADAVPAHTTQV